MTNKHKKQTSEKKRSVAQLLNIGLESSKRATAAMNAAIMKHEKRESSSQDQSKSS